MRVPDLKATNEMLSELKFSLNPCTKGVEVEGWDGWRCKTGRPMRSILDFWYEWLPYVAKVLENDRKMCRVLTAYSEASTLHKRVILEAVVDRVWHLDEGEGFGLLGQIWAGKEISVEALPDDWAVRLARIRVWHLPHVHYSERLITAFEAMDRWTQECFDALEKERISILYPSDLGFVKSRRIANDTRSGQWRRDGDTNTQ